MFYAKALVAPVVATLLLILETFGITPDMTVEQALFVAVGGVFTGVLTYLIPNKQ